MEFNENNKYNLKDEKEKRVIIWSYMFQSVSHLTSLASRHKMKNEQRHLKTLNIHYSSKCDQLNILMTDLIRICKISCAPHFFFHLSIMCCLWVRAIFVSARLKRPEVMNAKSNNSEKMKPISRS